MELNEALRHAKQGNAQTILWRECADATLSYFGIEYASFSVTPEYVDFTYPGGGIRVNTMEDLQDYLFQLPRSRTKKKLLRLLHSQRWQTQQRGGK